MENVHPYRPAATARQYQKHDQGQPAPWRKKPSFQSFGFEKRVFVAPRDWPCKSHPEFWPLIRPVFKSALSQAPHHQSLTPNVSSLKHFASVFPPGMK